MSALGNNATHLILGFANIPFAISLFNVGNSVMKPWMERDAFRERMLAVRSLPSKKQ